MLRYEVWPAKKSFPGYINVDFEDINIPDGLEEALLAVFQRYFYDAELR